MSVTSVWVGSVTDTDAWVRAKIDGAEARLVYATNSDLTDAATVDSDPVTEHGMASMRATVLAADTRYWFAVEVDGALDEDYPGQFRTHPPRGEPASFSFGVSSCAGLDPATEGVSASEVPDRISNDDAHDVIRQRGLDDEWILFAHLGDMHYYNIGSGGHVDDHDADTYRLAWDDVLLQDRQHELYRSVPLLYAWDDHDYGPNNSDSTAPGRLNAQQVYREKVPHYALPADQETDGNRPIFQSVQTGRVLVIASDTRSSRTPSDAPDDASKTMLGQQQKDWMRGLLEDTEAEFLVWLTPTPWLKQGSSDRWAGYTTEANELVDMFDEAGFLDRMIVVTGDTHHMGIDTGSEDVTFGGTPVFVFNPIDSQVNQGSNVEYDHAGAVGDGDRCQFGVISVADDGSEITVTGTGYIRGAAWASYSVTVAAPVEDDEDGDDDGPGPAPAPQSQAERRAQVDYYAADLVTGRVRARLPEATGNPKRTLGSSTTATVTVPIPLAGPAALGGLAVEATAPGRTMIVIVVNNRPSWGGIVLTRQGGSGAALELACVSLEGYLERRYVGDHAWEGADVASVIAAGLVADANEEGINLTLDAPSMGVTKDRTYHDDEDQTVYDALQELMGLSDGPEWTVDVDWEDEDRRAFTKIVRVRDRIGTASEAPDAVFDSRSRSEVDYTYTEDWADERGANHIIATGSGEGEDRPQSEPATDVLAGWPRYERRYSPGSSVDEVSELNSHAQDELALLGRGSRTWEVAVRWDQPPRLNLDWALGDDVAWDLVGHRHPDGVRGTGRVIGWELDLEGGTVEVTLLDPQEGVLSE